MLKTVVLLDVPINVVGHFHDLKLRVVAPRSFAQLLDNFDEGGVVSWDIVDAEVVIGFDSLSSAEKSFSAWAESKATEAAVDYDSHGHGVSFRFVLTLSEWVGVEGDSPTEIIVYHRYT
jgi:hypothetical protein